MDPRLKRKHQTILQQKRNFISNTELYEMMRSRQVYYVQNELRKELDRTLMALKQAEKMRLAGFRIQKAMLLKRMNILEKRRHHLNNNRVASTSGSIFFHGLSNEDEIPGISGQGHGYPKGFTGDQQHYFREVFSQRKCETPKNVTQNEKCDHTDIRVNTEIDQLPTRSRECQDCVAAEASVNSEWMCNTKNRLLKASVDAVQKEENAGLLHDLSQRKPQLEILSKLAPDESLQRAFRSITENSNGLVNGQTSIQDTVKEKVKTGKYNKRINNEEISNILFSHSKHLNRNHAKTHSNQIFNFDRNLGNVTESDDEIDKSDELSVVNDFQALNLYGRNKHVSVPFPGHSITGTNVKGRADDRRRVDVNVRVDDSERADVGRRVDVNGITNVSVRVDVSRQADVNGRVDVKGKIDVSGTADNLIHQNNETEIVHTTSKLDISDRPLTSPKDQNNLCLKTKHMHSGLTASKTTASLKLDTLEERKLKNNQNKQASFGHTSANNSSTRRQLLPVQSTPYLGRSTRLTLDKPDMLLKTQKGQTPSPSPGSLERTVTMIFVEDPTDNHAPPKSQFDVQAWLAYNRRKRGYTKIFDENSSVVTTAETSSGTNESIKKIRGPKSIVRFDFSRRLSRQVNQKPEMLTFRERSKEWYLNFLKVKRNQRFYDISPDIKGNQKPMLQLHNRSSYTLLPKIGFRSDRRTLATRHPKVTNGDDSHIILTETNDQKLQRLRDHSKFLQIKVQSFIYS